ncbi:MAG: CRISPR-associated endonuclease Cas1 [Anaerolineae bacterium]|nr:CRISPR-associated endonuclease Cas1 [Anaerolineae bacterium]NUQ06905.1 CRISPR-associated endonuclease Cas1 [Anaerolineae bacterium]
MTTVYVREYGAVIRKQGEQLLVTKGKQIALKIPLAELTQLVLMGNVQLTTPSAILMLRMEIDVVFMSYHGAFYGRLNPTTSKFAELRHQQLRLCDDADRARALAADIVQGKIANQRVILLRRADDAPQPIQTAVDGMMTMLKRAVSAGDLDQLRGFEGKAAAYYFQGIRALLQPDWGFEGRQYYPPPDPVNALLSLAYTLLRKDVEAQLQLVGLDPYLGFFHTLGYDRPALALDLMEEFRPSVADLVVLNLVRDGAVTLADFETTNDPTFPVRMSSAAVEKLVAAYEERLETRVQAPAATGQSGQSAYRRIIELQAYQIARLVRGEASRYEPLVMR